jgi:hypothetical protein
MTFAPITISRLADYWGSVGGTNLGIVPDARHRLTGGYHCGRSDLLAAGRLDSDYSNQHPRDRAGLTDAASAIDLGKLNGSLLELQKFSSWLVEQCQAKAPGTEDIREVIWSPDGKVVKRWSGIDRLIRDGYPNGTGNGDRSHLWHTHISWFRDSQGRDKIAVFRPYFEPEEDIVRITGIKAWGKPVATGELGVGHLLISPANPIGVTRTAYGPYAVPVRVSIYAEATLADDRGQPIDVDGNQPPRNGRERVYVVDAPAFAGYAYALVADVGNYTPANGTDPAARLDPGRYDVNGAILEVK